MPPVSYLVVLGFACVLFFAIGHRRGKVRMYASCHAQIMAMAKEIAESHAEIKRLRKPGDGNTPMTRNQAS